MPIPHGTLVVYVACGWRVDAHVSDVRYKGGVGRLICILLSLLFSPSLSLSPPSPSISLSPISLSLSLMSRPSVSLPLVKVALVKYHFQRLQRHRRLAPPRSAA